MASGIKHPTTVAGGDTISSAEHNLEHTYDPTLITRGCQLVWKATPTEVLAHLNKTNANNCTWTDLDLTSATSANAKMAYVLLKIIVDVTSGNDYVDFDIRQNGASTTVAPELEISGAQAQAGIGYETTAIIGLDSNQVIEYQYDMGAGWTVDLYIYVLAYWE
jgi:hypothetical protein